MLQKATVYFENTIEIIEPTKPVNKSGNVYVGREYHGKMVEVVVLK